VLASATARNKTLPHCFGVNLQKKVYTNPGHFNVNTYQLSDDIDLIRGRHHIGFGVDYVRTQNNILAGYLQNGSLTFNGNASRDPILDF
jgi:hypothetical protein